MTDFSIGDTVRVNAPHKLTHGAEGQIGSSLFGWPIPDGLHEVWYQPSVVYVDDDGAEHSIERGPHPAEELVLVQSAPQAVS